MPCARRSCNFRLFRIGAPPALRDLKFPGGCAMLGGWKGRRCHDLRPMDHQGPGSPPGRPAPGRRTPPRRGGYPPSRAGPRPAGGGRRAVPPGEDRRQGRPVRRRARPPASLPPAGARAKGVQPRRLARPANDDRGRRQARRPDEGRIRQRRAPLPRRARPQERRGRQGRRPASASPSSPCCRPCRRARQPARDRRGARGQVRGAQEIRPRPDRRRPARASSIPSSAATTKSAA